MSDKFNTYEYIAVIAPGSIIVVGASMILPKLATMIGDNGISVGGLGVLLVLSFVVGHLLQGFGNMLEKLLWSCLGGMPTDWVRQQGQSLLSQHQVDKLNFKLKACHGSFNSITSETRSSWYSLTREIYAVISAAGRSERVDSFNRTYGLLRGIAVSFLISTVCSCFLLNQDQWQIVVFLAIASVTASYRMYRFGVHYARELFTQYISI